MSPSSFEQAKTLFSEGLACQEAGRYAEAEQRYLSSLALLPGRVSTLVNLAATRLKLARPQDALNAAEQVLAVEPDNRDALYHRAHALLDLGRPLLALEAFERLLQIEPTLAPAWSTRGDILREMGLHENAMHAYEQALAHGADPELTGYYLAALRGAGLPPIAPRAYVEGLFDQYAAKFDTHLVEVLGYRAPAVLARRLAGMGRRFESALDLGCGTGLCGPQVKPLAQRLVGVDLSAQMLDRARALGLYDALVHADVTEHLQATREQHDLVIAADVFIYIGELAPVFAAVSRLLKPQGVFCFSVEATAADAQGFELLPSLRYAHSEAYLRGLAARHGFALLALSQEPIRQDQRHAVDGVFVYLIRCA